MFFHELKFEIKYLFQEIGLKLKHPKRKCDVGYHWSKILNLFFGHPWYCLKRGIKNIYIWFPLIWSNDVYDYTCLTELMDKQMEQMEAFFLSERPYSMRAKRDGKRIRWTRKLYQLWKDEHYSIKWYTYHHTKFPERDPFEHDPNLTMYDDFGEPVMYTCKSMSDEEREHYRGGSMKAHEMDKKVFKLYMKNLSHLQCWWD